jgi:hypothetical protein
MRKVLLIFAAHKSKNSFRLSGEKAFASGRKTFSLNYLQPFFKQQVLKGLVVMAGEGKIKK